MERLLNFIEINKKEISMDTIKIKDDTFKIILLCMFGYFLFELNQISFSLLDIDATLRVISIKPVMYT